MPLERNTFGWAAAVYPLPAPGSNGILQDADPALYFAIEFWRTVLQTYLGARWSAEATAAGRADIASTIVQAVVPYDPGPYLTETQFSFPLLAVYRVRSVSADRTLVWEHAECTWQVDWILPPITAAQAERFIPFLESVHRVLVNRTSNQQDSSYASNVMVWRDLAKIEKIGLGQADYGPYVGTDGLVFPSMHATCLVEEPQNPVPNAFGDITGLDVDIQEQPADGGAPLDHVVDLDIPVP